MSSKPKLTPEEKERRKHERSAARKNEKAAAEIGPLFAEQAPTTTAEDEYWHWRRNKARAADWGQRQDGGQVLGQIEEQHYRNLALSHIPEEWHGELCAYALRVYPSTDYRKGFWCEVLCGKQVVFSFKQVEDASIKAGKRLVPDRVFPPAGWVAPFTRETLGRTWWSLCAECGRYHAPEQGECLPSGDVGAVLPAIARAE